jgi:hypothetical protein
MAQLAESIRLELTTAPNAIVAPIHPKGDAGDLDDG